MQCSSVGLNVCLCVFFRGGLELSYPDVDIRSCMIIPKEFREKISQTWGPPQVRVATVDTVRQDTGGIYVVCLLYLYCTSKLLNY